MRKQAGFTLVEVLVTLLIMSLLLVAITQVLAGARRTRDLVHNVQESYLAGPAIMDLIANDLSGIVIANRQKLDYLRVEDNAKFGLDADRLDFVTSTNSVLITQNSSGTSYLRSDFCEVGYVLKSNRDFEGEFLEIWRRESFGVDDEPFEGGRFTFLHDRVRRFDIQVFNENGVDAEPIEAWGIATADEEFRGLPTRLEIELELELAPRLINEQSTRIRAEKRSVVYRRVIQFPQRLNVLAQVRPVPVIPEILPADPKNAGAGGGNGVGSPGGPGGGFPGRPGGPGGAGNGTDFDFDPGDVFDGLQPGAGGGGGLGGGGNPFGG